MRICYVADGTSIHVQRWANYLAQEGHDVHLICWKAMSGYSNNIHLHWLSKHATQIWSISQYVNFVFWIFEVRKLIKTIKPDIVDGHFSTVYGFLAACARFHPLVVTTPGSDILVQSKHNYLWAVLARYALKKADLVICRSPFIRNEISKLGIADAKIKVIIMGVDTSEFRSNRRNNIVKQKIGIESKQPVVISIRNLNPIYNVETLIRAIPLIIKEFPEVRFIIIGDGEDRERLQELSHSLFDSDVVRFISQVPRQQIAQYLASSDIYVSTSLSDGTSNSLLEAMACELAVVVTDIQANKAWIDDGENGYLFPVRDSEALAKKIIDLINDDMKRKHFGRISRDIVQKKAEQGTEMHKLEIEYESIIDKNIEKYGTRACVKN